MSPDVPLPRRLRVAALAELLYAPVPLFLAVSVFPVRDTPAGRGLLLVYLVQALAAVAIAAGLRRGWWAARVAALLLAAYVLALAVVQGPALVSAALARRDAVAVLALAVAAWAWLTQMAAFAGTLPDLTRTRRARRG